VITLLVTATVEILFIFVYKKPQTIPTPVIQTSTPTPTPVNKQSVLTPDQFDMLTNLVPFQNATLSLDEQILATVESVTLNASTAAFTIRLEKEATPLILTPETLKKTTVFIQDAKTGTNINSDINIIKAKDKIIFNSITMLGAGADNSKDHYIIYILKY
jgi:hypothetical protein